MMDFLSIFMNGLTVTPVMQSIACARGRDPDADLEQNKAERAGTG